MLENVSICFISQGNSKYEYMSIILALTIRYFHPDVEIIVGVPQPQHIYGDLLPETYQLFKEKNIQTVKVYNQISHDYKIGNKYAILEKACELSTKEYVLFLDSDIICTNPIEIPPNMYAADLCGMPTDYGDWVNKFPPTSKHFKWYSIFQSCGLQYKTYHKKENNPLFYSYFSKSPIWANYLNAVFLFIRNRIDIPKCLNKFTKILYEAHKSNDNKKVIMNSDQLAIAITISKLNLNMQLIPEHMTFSMIPKNQLNMVTNEIFIHYHHPKRLNHFIINCFHPSSLLRENKKELYPSEFNKVLANIMLKFFEYSVLLERKYWQSTLYYSILYISFIFNKSYKNNKQGLEFLKTTNYAKNYKFLEREVFPYLNIIPQDTDSLYTIFHKVVKTANTMNSWKKLTLESKSIS